MASNSTLKPSASSKSLKKSKGGKVSIQKTDMTELDETKVPDDAAHLVVAFNPKLQTVTSSFFTKFANTLVSLSLKNNRLQSIPEEIGELASLVTLRLDGNLLTWLPKSIGKLVNLQSLQLQNNQLLLIPDLSTLTALRELNISNNKLGALPFSVRNLKLKELTAHSNPFCFAPPSYVVSGGLSQIQKWMKTTIEEEQFSSKFYLHGSKPTLQEWLNTKMSNGKKNIEALSEKDISESPLFKHDTQVYFTLHTGVSEDENERKYMEDRHIIIHNLGTKNNSTRRPTQSEANLSKEIDRSISESSHSNSSPSLNKAWPNVSILAVFDGHGGSQTVDYIQERIIDAITTNKNWLAHDVDTIKTSSKGIELLEAKKSQRGKIRGKTVQSEVEEPDENLMKWVGNAVVEGFKTLDQQFLKMARQNGIFDGSTALVSMFIQREDSILLLNANVGDSRAIICRDGKAIRLTKDHKPHDPIERARIEALDGGFVAKSATGCYRVNGSLAVARAFGDLDLKQPHPFVIPDPDITCYEVTPSDQFIVVATDGLWDVMTDQKVVEFVLKKGGGDPQKASDVLMKEAIAEDSRDNITIVVAYFRWCVQH